MNLCQYPGCDKAATKSWALVELCADCYHDVKKETATFYKGELKSDDRMHFQVISQISKEIISNLNLKGGAK